MRRSLYAALLVVSSISFASNNTPILKYASGEHAAAGDKVKLQFTADQPGQAGHALALPNGLNVTYGQLVTLGDFYGVVGQPISSGTTESERRTRFVGAFNSFATSAAAVTELPNVLSVVQAEQKIVNEGMQRGEKPEDIYDKIAADYDRQWNCVTGGGCSTNTWWMFPGRYLKLAKQDFDHFGNNALQSYRTGHQLAIETAIAAHQTNDLKKLELAYEMNGFACHFLSDRFSSGHMRTTRSELPANVKPKVVGSLLAVYMHKEENLYGLHVHNLRGERWIAHGDHYYYDAMNDMNRDKLNDALQSSADEIFKAYQQGVDPKDDSVSNILPIPDETNNTGQIDIAPLFYWDNTTNTLYRRTDLSNVNDRHWTAKWQGWTTLALLVAVDGLPSEAQAQLVSEGYGLEALRYGLLTDKNVLARAHT
jgi:hypothetical protein